MSARNRIDSGDWEQGLSNSFEYSKALALLEALHDMGIEIQQDGTGNVVDAVAAGMAAKLLEKGFVPRWVSGRYMVMHRSSLTPLYSSQNRTTVYDRTGRRLVEESCEWRCATILIDIAYGKGSIDVVPADWGYLVRAYKEA